MGARKQASGRSSTRGQQFETNGFDRALPNWAVRPAVLLALFPLLVGIPSTESAGPSFLLIGYLLGCVVFAGSMNARRLTWPHLMLFGLALATFVWSLDATDGFEARRSSIVLAGSALCFAIGSCFDRSDRIKMMNATAWVPLALVGAVLWNFADGEAKNWSASLAAPLGNRSDLAEFAWPGLLCALVAFLTGRARWILAVQGLSACLLAVLLGASPVYAGVLALFGSTTILLFGSAGVASGSRLARVMLVVSAVCALALAIGVGWTGGAKTQDQGKPDQAGTVASDLAERRGLPEKDGDPDAAKDASQPGNLVADGLHGWNVRKAIWSGTWQMIAAHPMQGVGPGQFHQAFPPYRLPSEIQLSTYGGLILNPVEVEHPHNDTLIALSEFGLPLGALWLAILTWVTLSSLRSLRSRDLTLVGAATGWLGILLWSVWNAPLLGPVYSHGLAWIFAGMLVKKRSEPLPAKIGRALPFAVVCLGLIQLPRAFDFIQHGWLLKKGTNPANPMSAADRTQAVAAALQKVPDSALAMELLIHGTPNLPFEPVPSDQALALLEKLSQIHPHHRGVWNDWGMRLAQNGRWDEADQKFASATEVPIPLPIALTNRISLNEDRANAAGLQVAVEAAVAAGEFDPARYLPRAEAFLGRGYPLLAMVYGKLHNPALDFSNGDICFQQAKAAEAAGETQAAAAYKTGAQHLYARDHARADNFPAAIRSYRLAQRTALRNPGSDLPPIALRLELAAALALDGQVDQAKESLAGMTWSGLHPREKAHLPIWVQKALGLLLKP